MPFVIVTGGVLDSKQLIGPFETQIAADTWLNGQLIEDAVVASLIDPGTGAIEKAEQPQLFTFGKYQGKAITTVLRENPQYIIWAYQNVGGHGGISDEQFRMAGGSLPGPPPGMVVPPRRPPPPKYRPPPSADWLEDFADDDIPF